MRVVEVEWFDAYGGNYQIDIPVLINEPRLIVKSVGYLIFEDKDRIGLGFVLYEHENTCKHWQVIPKGMIKKMKVLKK